MVMYYKDYDTEGFFDEYFHPDGSPRDGASILLKRLEQLPGGELLRRQKATEARLFQMGVTFTVYGEEEGTERIFPFDIIPRVIESREWESLEKGLKQRIYALNLFIDDVYNAKKIIKDKIIPEELLKTSKCYRPQCEGFTPPRGVWCHISGTDLVRGGDGVYYVLEDNLRCPSGVSYVLENREVLKRTFPRIFEDLKIRPVDDYPYRLREMLQYMAPDGLNSPTVALLTPGIYNSAYFEHSFLAQQMGIELVEGGDLVVSDGYVYMKTTKGLQKVDVIYRRIDDDFIDPLAFREDSLLGVPGIMDVYKSGRIALVNAIGTGIADDKIIYAYVPKIIKYYTGEDPILPNVPTYVCWEELDRKYVVENLESLVVKPANESGGYGIMIGPKVSASVREEFRLKILADPRNYIAQPTVSLSRVPILAGERFEGRHVDFRPYTLYGEDIYVMPGGLTRVALKKGSLVVNSSQGGGSKDTWVLRDTP
jgi:uncharacterized circularly permuted ATP-grasp superfamily protein